MTTRTKWLAIGGILVASYGGLWTILEASSHFGLEILKGVGWFGHPILLSLALNITAAIAYWRRLLPGVFERPARARSTQYSGEELSKTLAEQFQKMADCGDYQTVLRIGRPLSRALWLEGQYDTRVAVGRVVEEAASRLNEPHAQAQALVDDIGWTSVALGRLDEAEKNILRGIDIANGNGLDYLAAKGHRHLGGIEIQRTRPSKALSWLDLAEEAAKGIKDEKAKLEMIAGIRYGQAEAYLRLDRLNDAERSSSEARELFVRSDDRSRAVKTYAQLGKVCERKGNILEARDFYRKGLKLAEDTNRRDEIIRNHLGLARVAWAENKKEETEKHLDTAKEMQKVTPLVFEVDSIETQIQEVERRNCNGR